jgi:hypothetical protein
MSLPDWRISSQTVEDDQVDALRVFLEQLERRRPIADRSDVVALGLKVVLDADRQVLFVFHDQDVLHRFICGRT